MRKIEERRISERRKKGLSRRRQKKNRKEDRVKLQ